MAIAAGASAIGELLDRAVHVTVRRVVPIGLPFVIADAAGSLVQGLSFWGVWGWLLLAFIGMVFENRARVIMIRTAARERGAGIAWGAALRHPAALAFAVVGIVDLAVPFIALGIVATMLAGGGIARIPAGSTGTVLAAAGLAILLVIEVGLFVAAMLTAFAGAVATVDTVLNGTAPHRALGRWLREAFRRRSLLTSLVAALAFVLLVAGTPLLLSLVPYGPVVLREIVDAVPEGLGDAIAMMFAWGWRDMLLDRRQGRDIEALLDASDQSAAIASPSAISPGVTTSQ